MHRLSLFQNHNGAAWLVVVGASCLLIGALHVFGDFVDPRPWGGPTSWRKPVVFSGSFGLATLACAWLVRALRPSAAVHGASILFAVSAAAEVFLVILQAWRGVPSHFNLATPFDAAIHWTMAALAALLWVALFVWTAAAFFTDLRGAPSVIAWGGMLGMHLSFVAGVFLAIHGTSAVVGGGSPVPVWGEAGQMLPPHAIGLHALQVFLVAWVAVRVAGLPEDLTVRWLAAWVAVVIAGWMYAFAQMLLGRSLFDPSGWAVGAATVTAVVVLAGCLSAERLGPAGSWRQLSGWPPGASSQSGQQV